MQDSLKINIHLLIVDDEVSTLDVLTHQLEREGYKVSSCVEAEKALEIVRHEDVDLVLTDFAMPKMNGLDFLDEMRRRRPELPVILLTGYGSIEMAVEAMKRGAVDFITKPASFAEISIRIEKALEGLERKKSYEMLKDQVEELKKACEDIGKSSDSRFQSEKLAAMGLIVSGIAHEINNPLTAVIGYSQLLIDTGGQDMTRQLRVVRDQAQRCAKIIQEMMFFARRRKPIFASMNLRQVIHDAVQETKKEFEDHKIILAPSPEKGELSMSGDFGLLKKVFSQILLNAVQALQERDGERKVEIRIKDTEKHFQIEIQDNGPGIPAEYLPKIFDPFFSTKEVARGVGLGLSLCYGLVADHGGRILASSEKTEGALFTVILPKKNSDTIL